MKEAIAVLVILCVLYRIAVGIRFRKERQIRKIMDNTGKAYPFARQQWYEERGKQAPPLKRSAFQDRLERMAKERSGKK